MNRLVDTHQSTAWWRSHRATSRCTAGSARRQRSGRGGKRVAWATPVCVALALPQLQPEQKAQGQHHCGGMPVKAWPQAALILIPPQFLFSHLGANDSAEDMQHKIHHGLAQLGASLEATA